MCLQKLFASMYIWIFSIAHKMPPFVVLIALSSANSRTLICSKVVRRPSEDLATSCPSARGGQSHTQNNDAVTQTPLLPFTFPTASSSFLFLLCLRPYLDSIAKIKRFLPFSVARERLPHRTTLLQGVSPEIWSTFSFYPYFHSCITTNPFIWLSGYFIHNRLKSGHDKHFFTETDTVVTSCAYWIPF